VIRNPHPGRISGRVPPRQPGAYLSLVFAYACLMVGCLRSSQSSLAGHYVERHEKGKIVLTLAPDQTFLERVEPRGRTPTVARGHWSFNSRQSTVTLDGAILPGHSFGDPQYRDYTVIERGGLWVLTVERGVLGTIRLVDSPDFGLAFRRVSAPGETPN